MVAKPFLGVVRKLGELLGRSPSVSIGDAQTMKQSKRRDIAILARRVAGPVRAGQGLHEQLAFLRRYGNLLLHAGANRAIFRDEHGRHQVPIVAIGALEHLHGVLQQLGAAANFLELAREIRVVLFLHHVVVIPHEEGVLLGWMGRQDPKRFLPQFRGHGGDPAGPATRHRIKTHANFLGA